jgi:hypothetical protein
MGSTMCKGGSLQQVLQFKSNYPNPTIRITYKIIQVTTKYKRYKDIQVIYKITKEITNHTLGPSMPQVALTPLGLPSLATNHKSTQGLDK